MRQRTKYQRRTRSVTKAGSPALKIAVVYDGFSDVIRVSEMWSRLSARRATDVHFDGRAWNFSSLRDLLLGAQAAMHTIEADVVVLSVNGQAGLPVHIWNWIDAWLPWKKGRRDAFVVMVDTDAPPRNQSLCFREDLRRVAEQGEMAFFCNAGLQPTQMEARAGC